MVQGRFRFGGATVVAAVAMGGGDGGGMGRGNAAKPPS